MAQNKPFVVELLEPEQMKYFLSIYGKKACCCYNTPTEKYNAVAKSCIKTSHFSPSRGQQIEFIIKDIPRSCADQIVRHSIGTSPAMLSFRYVGVEDSFWYTPSIIQEDTELDEIYDEVMIYTREMYEIIVKTLKSKGYTNEQSQEAARGIINMNTNTNLVIGMSLESIINFCKKRLCSRSEESISVIANEIAKLVIKEIPEMSIHLKAPCVNNGEWSAGRCPEKHMSCGKPPKYLSGGEVE